MRVKFLFCLIISVSCLQRLKMNKKNLSFTENDILSRPSKVGWLADCLIHYLSVYVDEEKEKLISFKRFVCLYSMNFGAMQQIDTITIQQPTNQPTDRSTVKTHTHTPQLPHQNGLNFIPTFDIITTQYFTIEIILIGKNNGLIVPLVSIHICWFLIGVSNFFSSPLHWGSLTI